MLRLRPESKCHAAKLDHALASEDLVRLGRPLDQHGLAQLSQGGPPNIVDHQGASLAANMKVMLARRKRQLAQSARCLLVCVASCPIGLEVGKSIADAVNIGLDRMSWNVVEIDPSARSASLGEKIVHKLQQRSSGHAHSFSLIELRLVRVNSVDGGLTVRVNVENEAERDHGECTGDRLQLGGVDALCANDASSGQSGINDVNWTKVALRWNGLVVFQQPNVSNRDRPGGTRHRC